MMVLRNPRTREALLGAASQVNAKVRQGAGSFVEGEVAPLRARIDELEERVARLERLLAAGEPTRSQTFDRDSV